MFSIISVALYFIVAPPVAAVPGELWDNRFRLGRGASPPAVRTPAAFSRASSSRFLGSSKYSRTDAATTGPI